MCIFCEDGKDSHMGWLSDADVLEAEKCPCMEHRIPTTIITGFLGSGTI